MADDDDLRFGDVKDNTDRGGSGRDIPSGEGIINLLIQGIVAVVIFYVFLSVIQTVFNIPIPFI